VAPSFFIETLCSFLLLLHKKETKEKESGKDNLPLFVRLLHKAIMAPPNSARFAPFPVCPCAKNDFADGGRACRGRAKKEEFPSLEKQRQWK